MRLPITKCVTGIIAIVVCCGIATAQEDKRPNVLFIAIDDLNDYISPLDNHPGIITPNFERLAKRSVTFANAHCAAPACHPSRVAIMTGVHPSTSGIYRNLFGAHGPRWRDESPALRDATVLSQHFRNHGYRAVGGGKIFHTLQWTPGDSQNDPNAWDEYRGDPLDPISKDWPRPVLVPDSEAGIGPGRPLGDSQLFGAAPLMLPDEQTGDHRVVDWAIEQLHKDRTKPLFLAVGLFRPHIPFEVPEKWFDLYPLTDVQLPDYLDNDLEDAHVHGRVAWHQWVVENRQWKKLMQGYLASISYVDHQLGRLLDGLEDSGMKDNTIIVLWSDHGFHIGEKDNWEKFALWEQTTRVPLFIHAPGLSEDGETTATSATLTDVYPTLCELAGLPIPSQCDGESLVQVLRSPNAELDRVAVTSFHFRGEQIASHAVKGTRYRYIKYGDGFEALYDLREDPNEFRNVIDEFNLSEIKNKLASNLPSDPAESRGIPEDSIYHRGRRNVSRPDISGKELRISLDAIPNQESPDGVLISQGGDHHGFSVFVKNQRLHFAIRRNQQLTVIASREATEGEKLSIRAELLSDKLRLHVNGVLVAESEVDGLIDVNPNEGRNVGSDPQSAVANYAPPFPYAGRIENIVVE